MKCCKIKLAFEYCEAVCSCKSVRACRSGRLCGIIIPVSCRKNNIIVKVVCSCKSVCSEEICCVAITCHIADKYGNECRNLAIFNCKSVIELLTLMTDTVTTVNNRFDLAVLNDSVHSVVEGDTVFTVDDLGAFNLNCRAAALCLEERVEVGSCTVIHCNIVALLEPCANCCIYSITGCGKRTVFDGNVVCIAPYRTVGAISTPNDECLIRS